MDKGRESMNFEQKIEGKKERAYCRVFKFWLKPMDYWVIKLKDGLKPASIDVS